MADTVMKLKTMLEFRDEQENIAREMRESDMDFRKRYNEIHMKLMAAKTDDDMKNIQKELDDMYTFHKNKLDQLKERIEILNDDIKKLTTCDF